MNQDFSNFHKTPEQISATAAQYGYVAFNSINIRNHFGMEYQVQPVDSPFYISGVLPPRTLIPFTNITAYEIDDVKAANGSAAYIRAAGQPPVKAIQKTALDCVAEMVSAYEQWDFVHLKSLSGLSWNEAFHIFQVIQPFNYSIKDLTEQLEWDAVARIKQTSRFTADYEGEAVTIHPLPDHLKAAAEGARQDMFRSANKAFELASEIIEKTTQQMEQFYATGNGKRMADPRDVVLFEQMGIERPTGALGRKQKEQNPLGDLAALLTQNKASEVETLKAQVEQLTALVQQLASPKVDTQAVSIGDTVTVGGQEGKVTAKRFGNVTVSLTDGSTVTVKKEEIE